jgi:plastocyanin
MTSQWRTSFDRPHRGSRQPGTPAWLLRASLAAALAVLVSPVVASAIEITGRVELADSIEASVRKHRDFSGVVVWLEPASTPVAALKPGRAQMIQKGKRFQPHVLAVPVGTTVDFPNFDPIFHNAFSNFAGQPFDVGLYPPGTNRSVTFRRAGFVRVFCNIHPDMSAVIAVLDTPWYAVTERNGGFRIENVPPGEYRVRVFHERATEKVLNSLASRIRAEGDTLELQRMVVSESGFLPVPHKNKYGREYPAAADDHVLYPGARK